ncbi:hypothetical protein BUALT_Bualt19G0060900 [Buddleja alternifolia]|uniref:No apical meristem-associated C-terminal domain-containing protein n=1 Tax=Buddleja alternifolia TaxID=168488 RepID=A0AAV6W1S0_9LAMI|nr:hypothetical protein BUALT_Bualt19G0060900 [Buddleja alternifolia]
MCRKMPPKEAILHRPITRKSKSTNQEASRVDFFSSLVDIRSNFPSLPVSPPSARPSSSESSDLGDDSIGTGNKSSHLLPSDNSTASVSKKKGREQDGKLLEIEFSQGFKKPRRFAKHFANGIGIVFRHSPELDFVSQWGAIQGYQKLPVYAGLDSWSIIKGWTSDRLVQAYMEEIFQSSYMHWKGRLSACYKEWLQLRLRNQAKESGASSISEREIVKQTLGKRSGYERGLGYGVVVENSSKRSTYETSQLESFKKKLSSTEEELRDVASHIKSQQEMTESQQTIIQGYGERCQRQDQEIARSKESQHELKDMMLTLLQK